MVELELLKFKPERARVATFVSLLERDLNKMSKLLKQPKLEEWQLPSPGKLQDALVISYQYSLSLKSNEAKTIRRKLRIYFMLLESYKRQIVSSGSGLGELEQAMAEIIAEIGSVPRLKTRPLLPDAIFLPKNIQHSIARWKEKSYDRQAHHLSGLTDKLRFFRRAEEGASIRMQLDFEATSTSVSYIETPRGNLLLNLADLDYYETGLLHTDHFLPTASLVERIDEMVEAMNYNPYFYEEMIKSPINDSYFIAERTGAVKGSFWLYMAHYNSVQNLWFLLASQNMGEGKVATDPIEWLSTFEIGREYLQYLQENNITIDKSGIFYLAEEFSLKDSFTRWVMERKREHIKTLREISKQKEVLREAVSETTDTQVLMNQRRSLRVQSALIKYKELEKRTLIDKGEGSSSGTITKKEEESPNSLSSGSEVDRELAQSYYDNAEYMETKRKLDSLESNLFSRFVERRHGQTK